MKRLAIIGAGDLGMQIAHHASVDGHYEVAGFFDDTKSGQINGSPVLGKLDDVIEKHKEGLFDCLMIGIGYNHLKFKGQLFDRLKTSVPFGTIIHSHAYIDKSAQIGAGVLILPGCVVDKNAIIADNVLLNLHVTISHDCIVGPHSFLAPKVAIAGFCTLGKRCFLGIGTTVIDNLTIADDVHTGGGSLVIRDIPEGGKYVGSPVRPVSNR